MRIMVIDLEKIKALRAALHEIPEPSMKEMRTKAMLMSFLKENTKLELVDCGSWFYACYKGKQSAEPIAFRADFDAVVCGDGKSRHLCGHDGHSAILAGLALQLSKRDERRETERDAQLSSELPPELSMEHSPELSSELALDRDAYLIFQPGEETGQGGRLCSELITEKGITEVYGFHNIPGYPRKAVLLLTNTFACASTGLEIHIMGKASHAAYPDQGKNPAKVIAELELELEAFIRRPHRGIVLGTVIGIDVGSSSYGVSAGEGTLRLTLRAEYQQEYDELLEWMTRQAQIKCAGQGMSCDFRRIEEFPATQNDAVCVRKVQTAAHELGLKTITPPEPFRWSEDFGYYLQRCPGAFFGIGCGEEHAGLHTPEYEFDDEIIETVVELYQKLYMHKEKE